MKLCSFLLVILLSVPTIKAQNLLPEMTYPDTLRTTSDSIFITSGRWKDTLKLKVSTSKDLNWGTYGYRGVYFDVWTDTDTLRIPHVNHPYEQRIVFPLISTPDTTELILRFQSTLNANFTDAYLEKNKGKIDFAVPEVYELANIALYLSQCAGLTGNKPQTDYSSRVQEHFEAYREHSLINLLNKLCEKNLWSNYYGFRENALGYHFKEDRLQYTTPYKTVRWDASLIEGGQFRNLLYLVQDFADVSNFRQFYLENQSYYQTLIERQKQLIPVRKMWEWLEAEFPQRYHSYRIVFSPLIGGSHSTQRFTRGLFTEPDFQECVMFINAPEDLDAQSGYSESLKVGLMSGIVFTEIDHNYVNPTTNQYREGVKLLMKDKAFWANDQARENYSSEIAIFNEYMTHSLFNLFVSEVLEPNVRKEVIERRIKLMERRGFPKFREFNAVLMKALKNRKHTIYEAYPELIEQISQR